jgi:hypothetical protein
MDTMPDNEARRDRGVIVLLIKDLFFSVAVRNTVRTLGFESHLVKTPDAFADSRSVVAPVLGIVDLHAVEDPLDWECVTELVEQDVPVLVFGPHRDVDGMRAAKAAGVTRVVSNGQFHAEMGAFIERYARDRCRLQPALVEGDEDALTMSNVPPGMSEPFSQTTVGDYAPRD